MKNTFYLIALFLVFGACQNNKKNTVQSGTEDTTRVVPKTLPALIGGEFEIEESAFGEVQELNGLSKPVNEIFRVSESQLIASDSLLIIKNRSEQHLFMAYSLPDFQLIKTFGKLGKGPGEFQFPRIVNDESGKNLCFVHELANDKLFALSRELELKDMPVPLKETSKMISDKQLHGISSNAFLYVESVKQGKAIFKMEVTDDTTQVDLLKNLAFSEDHKNWAAYIGDFGANAKIMRAVYAYKYFKRLIFLDLESGESRSIYFKEKNDANTGDAKTMMAPDRLTHYWGMSANDNYVYVLYSGRTPIDVTKELQKSSGYIFVEQYDWNGNPIRKFKLDNWGYFCVNKPENKIYLVSTSDVHPFVEYQLPVK